ncbi:hypothetical protein BAY60_19155 [Prauserella muralis]|uniref:AbiEi antitoxin C-terminal domain-containing protein n=1 Tax=Prauserella muralis TaxID=588067 RepID=A0A2V4B6G4_9PSEU|nr:hypothetical protein BAY60_19155 [Prauserella muralis]TWE27678.1 hypothetical protein FHX69_0322 [Prauserella muralis]
MDWEDVELAARHQILTCAELESLGVTKRMIWARVRTGGPWRRILPGVVMLRNGTPTRAQALEAALRYAGKEAVVTGLAAARLHGLEKFSPTEQVHVLVPHRHRRTNKGYVIVERTTRMPPIVTRGGFPTADVTRAVLDAARRMDESARVQALLAEAVQRGRTTPDRLREELEAGSDRGSALPRAALTAITEGARSVAEGWGMRVAARSGLPPMRWNVRLRTGSGLVLPSPDGWIDDVALAMEVDSLEHHLAPDDYRRTLERHNIMTAHGIVVVHVVPSQLRTEPDKVIAHLRESYRHAARRPRPDIVAQW